jgi:phosphate butyryltransferase
MTESFFAGLSGRVKAGSVCRVAIPIAQDEACAYAVSRAAAEGLIKPILIGDPTEIRRMYGTAAVSNQALIIDSGDQESACRQAVAMVRDGEADILMKGNVSTGKLLKAVLNSQDGIKKNPLLSHVCFFEIPGHDGLKVLTDAAINIAPDLGQYEQITDNAIEAYSLFGHACPKVALLSANEKVSEKVPSTVLAKALAEKHKGRSSAVIEGPISLDLSVSEFSVNVKNYQGRIRGDADIFVVPRIETGNVFYKALQYFTAAQMAGVVYGARCPVVLTSRSDRNDTKFFSLLLGMVLWQKQSALGQRA